jgi:2-methylcitrate dehydratase
VIDGKEGMVHCLGEAWDFSWIEELGQRWMITDCGMKSFPIEALMHSPVSATLEIIKGQDLKPEDVTEIRIESIARAADILSDPAKYDPQSKESADHSLPYCIAAAVTDRMVTPRQFRDERLWNETLRAQMAKVKVVANDEFEQAFPAKQCTRVTIKTISGQEYTAERDFPKGDPRDPMSLEDVGDKFDALAEPIMSADRRKALREAIFNIDTISDVGELMKLTVADQA